MKTNSDERLQLLISWTLRGGLLTASALGLLGGVLFMAAHPTTASFTSFAGESAPFNEPARIIHQAFTPMAEDAQLRGLSIVQIGILVLLLTPVLRVLFSVVGFALEGDRRYVGITLIVLVVLTISICLH